MRMFLCVVINNCQQIVMCSKRLHTSSCSKCQCQYVYSKTFLFSKTCKTNDLNLKLHIH